LNTIISPFPDINDVFQRRDEREEFVFLPLLTVKFPDNTLLKDKQFHFISIWDTGSYEKEYFNDYRQDTHIIRFKVVDNKYLYPGDLKFPFVEQLGSAYRVIKSNFENHIDYYLRPKSHREFNSEDKTLIKGGELVHEAVKDLPKWECKYYFERVTKYLYAKTRYLKYHKVFSDFTYSSTFIKTREDEEKIKSEFNSFGKEKDELIKGLLSKPAWIQSDETPVVDGGEVIFIGSVTEYDFTNGTSEIFLFYDKKNEYVYQIFQWT
jgi:hypothetical protein